MTKTEISVLEDRIRAATQRAEDAYRDELTVRRQISVDRVDPHAALRASILGLAPGAARIRVKLRLPALRFS